MESKDAEAEASVGGSMSNAAPEFKNHAGNNQLGGRNCASDMGSGKSQEVPFHLRVIDSLKGG